MWDIYYSCKTNTTPQLYNITHDITLREGYTYSSVWIATDHRPFRIGIDEITDPILIIIERCSYVENQQEPSTGQPPATTSTFLVLALMGGAPGLLLVKFYSHPSDHDK
jgi:hypothetical protein